MADRFAFIYSSQYNQYSYGTDHPFNVHRYRLTFDLISELRLVNRPEIAVVDSPVIPETSLLCFHTPDYLNALRLSSAENGFRANFLYGLGDLENPVFSGVYDWARRVCGGTLEAARRVAEGEARVAFHIAGGCHHAHAARASGFSYLNDAVVAIHALLARGLRVAYIDLDAHHGDAVQEAFYGTDRVLTVSLHEHGGNFFPCSGTLSELGAGAGYGYSINVPLTPHADDLIFEQAFKGVVMPLLQAYRPDVLVTQLGVDALRTDPLTRLELTTGSFEFAARAFLKTGIPWVALGGGGYDQMNVARTWALIWGIILGEDLPDVLPSGFSQMARELGLRGSRLRDIPRLAHPDDFHRAQVALEKTLSTMERKVFPLHGLRRGP